MRFQILRQCRVWLKDAINTSFSSHRQRIDLATALWREEIDERDDFRVSLVYDMHKYVEAWEPGCSLV